MALKCNSSQLLHLKQRIKFTKYYVFVF